MLFSIIIPVYNAASTLDTCLKSILNQDFQDWQALIVNDGSTDLSGAIAGEYARRDPRFRLIQTNNRGSGAARNRGLEQAQGEYVLYMDADDYWFRRDLLRQLDRRITAQPADVYMYQMVKVKENGDVLERYTKLPFTNADRVMPLVAVYPDLVRDGQTLASACNKCVRRSLLTEQGIRFREDILCEDIDWVLQLFSHVQTICLLNLGAYAYTQHKGESRSRHPDAPNDLTVIIQDWEERLAAGNIAHPEAVAGLIAFEYGICMGSHHRLTKENRQRMRRLQHLLEYGLDRKTRLIRRFCGIFGYPLTCLAIRVYLILRRIW